MIAARGAINMQHRNITAATSAERPVRPPASTPEADSTKVVTVEVPVTDPATVPIASERSASFIFGMLPFSSSIFARDAVPTRVPIVSNISIRQKVIIRVMIVNHPISINPLKSRRKSVVSAISLNGGTNDAVFNDSKGLVSKKIASPAQ